MSSAAGRVVVVTGGTRGIGLGLAREMLGRGCRVVVCGRSDASVRTAVAELDAAAPGRVTGVPADVSGHAAEPAWSEAQPAWSRSFRRG